MRLVLEDGTIFEGEGFGSPLTTSGEVVFSTGMVGYPESLTDPSFYGQILVLTFPMVGNYGVPARNGHGSVVDKCFESDRIQVRGLIVSHYSEQYHHWQAGSSLKKWLFDSGVPALTGVDTRALTKKLREFGTMLGRLEAGEDEGVLYDPSQENLVARVSIDSPREIPSPHEGEAPKVVLVDCGCKNGIISQLHERGVTILRVPWNYDFNTVSCDGVVLSNGPGDPTHCLETVKHIRKAISRGIPILGICLGNQLLSIAAGARTFKLKYGHRSQNQPVMERTSNRCFITSQNHGYAVDMDTIPSDWEPWFINLNDGTCEGIRHRFSPFQAVQFHPEAQPGPVDTAFIIDDFISSLAK